MVFKLAAALVALATAVTAANIKRVACPDGVNFASNEAVCSFSFLSFTLNNKNVDISVSSLFFFGCYLVLRVLRFEG